MKRKGNNKEGMVSVEEGIRNVRRMGEGQEQDKGAGRKMGKKEKGGGRTEKG